MEIRVLQYFLAIAKEQSIIRAAESLPAHSFHTDQTSGGRAGETAIDPRDQRFPQNHLDRGGHDPSQTG